MNEKNYQQNKSQKSISEPAKRPEKVQARVFDGEKKVHHDLFKLNVAMMEKNTAWDGTLQIVSVEHCHFFHTVDSDGRKQLYSSSIGGHFHKMEVVEVEGGVPKVKCASGPMKFAKRKDKRTGKWQKVIVPINDWDYHTHDIEYLKSEEVTIRKTNVEAVKVQALEAEKGKPVPGILG